MRSDAPSKEKVGPVANYVPWMLVKRRMGRDFWATSKAPLMGERGDYPNRYQALKDFDSPEDQHLSSEDISAWTYATNVVKERLAFRGFKELKKAGKSAAPELEDSMEVVLETQAGEDVANSDVAKGQHGVAPSRHVRNPSQPSRGKVHANLSRNRSSGRDSMRLRDPSFKAVGLFPVKS
ncbi:hypothetical protein COLO4_02872 [Corchorus olitorius]|uniref:Uncharacterized protein n=1 Tax=Corchorus olitorius TaxID=93759 RepID=A0A1R3L060_9ROSI|nr:hypothetical protein COLO4_02872 [Corchorus olitorius]